MVEEKVVLIKADLRENGEVAMREIYDAHYISLWCYARFLISHNKDAEDIVANAFFKLWMVRHTIYNGDNVKPLLVTIVKHMCVDYLKHKKVKRTAAAEIIHTSEIFELNSYSAKFKSEVLQAAVKEIQKLPRKMQVVMRLTYFENLTNKEIAEKLGITESTVRVQKRKGMCTIRNMLLKDGLL